MVLTVASMKSSLRYSCRLYTRYTMQRLISTDTATSPQSAACIFGFSYFCFLPMVSRRIILTISVMINRIAITISVTAQAPKTCCIPRPSL